MIPEADRANKVWQWRPRLRPIEVLPLQTNSGRVLALRDPGRLAPKMLYLSPAAAIFLPLFNGRNDLRDIQAALFRASGELIGLERIEGLVRTLDENYFLEGETFEAFLVRTREEFAASPGRPALLAGQAYPEAPESLAEVLASYYDHPSGPGREATAAGARPRGLIAPHIDFGRGGPGYAWTWSQLDPSDPPDLAVILGTAHGPTLNPLALCRKDFETPFGPARCERGLAEALAERLGDLITADEFVHRGEHSVEFQAVWLMSRLEPEAPTRILPWLCGSFHQLMEEGRAPEDWDDYEASVSVIKEALDRWTAAGKKVLAIASVDLSHVGPQFGDGFSVTPGVQAEIKALDLEYMTAATQGDYRSFYRLVAGQRDRTHVCGLAAIYTLLRLLDGPSGRLLHYDQWVDPAGQGLVSFASAVYR
ncbi:MAG: AmmeMemoRadiSam system protein B [Thermodesulfobacteriota bacterium]